MKPMWICGRHGYQRPVMNARGDQLGCGDCFAGKPKAAAVIRKQVADERHRHELRMAELEAELSQLE